MIGSTQTSYNENVVYGPIYIILYTTGYRIGHIEENREIGNHFSLRSTILL